MESVVLRRLRVAILLTYIRLSWSKAIVIRQEIRFGHRLQQTLCNRSVFLFSSGLRILQAINLLLFVQTGWISPSGSFCLQSCITKETTFFHYRRQAPSLSRTSTQKALERLRWCLLQILSNVTRSNQHFLFLPFVPQLEHPFELLNKVLKRRRADNKGLLSVWHLAPFWNGLNTNAIFNCKICTKRQSFEMKIGMISHLRHFWG